MSPLRNPSARSNAILSLGAAMLAFCLPAEAGCAQAAPGFDGTWIYDKSRSGPHRELQETVTMADHDGKRAYRADVMVNGVHSGARFEALTDGTPAPLYDVLSGRQIGIATLESKGPQVDQIRMMFAGSDHRTVNLEHWLTNDGTAFIAVLKDGEGHVTSLMTFVRR
ncbi:MULTISPECIES: hypothetical protein [unclassified Novosphingobium]|uniref:hypothetical protein n=1 Tax=unclassified Novosphingobium TaxID=2644732 RepID=UPI001494FC5E|nr:MULTISPECIES: hypothetical protein [unclassified Novosphingobium]MBB3359885.1 hypothetical protein [Novosphingobium sp. BK256]MBB3376244.1 hypothetical protein [Novosphingobium sp. BK280]MBB3380658.1 hypothetical protein [Novosphingobium sp. BK258]MBB3422346.1 hypothetical protein [Novosphingobium sp. BK267]MBB3451046.1 hypothetical protein [Novosphingobium sp. BK352]